MSKKEKYTFTLGHGSFVPYEGMEKSREEVKKQIQEEIEKYKFKIETDSNKKYKEGEKEFPDLKVREKLVEGDKQISVSLGGISSNFSISENEFGEERLSGIIKIDNVKTDVLDNPKKDLQDALTMLFRAITI